MIYHDKSEDISVMQVRKKREDRWEKLIKRYEGTNKSWNIEEILIILKDLQDYLCVDFPEEKNITQQQLRQSFKNVCQVALSLGEKQKNIKTPLTRYETNKLCYAIKVLKSQRGK
ncbi:hypothetical protein PRVXT_001002 [Proteinivorax tanatarense]|uniref:Uncharacterized protein n=1 Tax=Proteinivorax tanatarense TaxID=1260629 RepID=A0AAU7VP41_9FIRM